MTSFEFPSFDSLGELDLEPVLSLVRTAPKDASHVQKFVEWICEWQRNKNTAVAAAKIATAFLEGIQIDMFAGVRGPFVYKMSNLMHNAYIAGYHTIKEMLLVLLEIYSNDKNRTGFLNRDFMGLMCMMLSEHVSGKIAIVSVTAMIRVCASLTKLDRARYMLTNNAFFASVMSLLETDSFNVFLVLDEIPVVTTRYLDWWSIDMLNHLMRIARGIMETDSGNKNANHMLSICSYVSKMTRVPDIGHPSNMFLNDTLPKMVIYVMKKIPEGFCAAARIAAVLAPVPKYIAMFYNTDILDCLLAPASQADTYQTTITLATLSALAADEVMARRIVEHRPFETLCERYNSSSREITTTALITLLCLEGMATEQALHSNALQLIIDRMLSSVIGRHGRRRIIEEIIPAYMLAEPVGVPDDICTRVSHILENDGKEELINLHTCDVCNEVYYGRLDHVRICTAGMHGCNYRICVSCIEKVYEDRPAKTCLLCNQPMRFSSQHAATGLVDIMQCTCECGQSFSLCNLCDHIALDACTAKRVKLQTTAASSRSTRTQDQEL